MEALVWVVSLLLLALAVGSDGMCDERSTRLALLANLTTAYDRKRRPNATGAPVDVDVQIHMTALTEINQKEEKLGIAGFYRVWWTDSRLAYPSTSEGGCFDRLPLNKAEREQIWQPDLFFDNVLEEIYGPQDLFVVFPSGQIHQSQRLMNNMYSCSMDFKKLPFDVQTCTIQIASYSLDATQVRIAPKGGGAQGLTLPAERPGSTAWDVIDVLSKTMVVEDDSGRSWTIVQLQVVLKRQWGYWIMAVGLKAVLFVVISWCGFFVNRTMAPARVSIGVIPVLIMINLINATEGHLPPLPYSTTLNDYLMTCLVFTSTGVLEYALVSYFLQREVWYAEKYAVLLRIGKVLKRKDRAASAERATTEVSETQGETGEGSITIADSYEDARPRASEGARSRRRSSRPPIGKKTHDQGVSRIFDEHPVINSIFKEFDRERNGKYSVSEVRNALKGFAQYRSHREVREMFSLIGVARGEDMTLRQFEQFLADPEKYLPVTSTRRSFWDMPPSLQLDIFMRFAFPLIWASTSMIHGAMVLL